VIGFLSEARKMARPCEYETFFTGSSSSGSERSQLLNHIKLEGSESVETTSVRGTS
jgi:hypothetical protein